MISITTAQWYAWISAFLWPFLRVLGLVIADPVLGNTAVPRAVRVGLCVLIALVLAPVLPAVPALDPASAQGVLVAAQQLLIGLSLGFVVRLTLDAVETAGQLVGLQMGLGFAVFFDPQSAAQTAVMGQYLGLFGSLIFLGINGHGLVLGALADSFQALPVQVAPVSPGGFYRVVLAAGTVFSSGLAIALPVVTALLIANLALGVITRAAPQLNVFAVGFPVTLALGFAGLYLSIPYLAPAVLSLIEGIGATLEAVLAAFRPVVH